MRNTFSPEPRTYRTANDGTVERMSGKGIIVSAYGRRALVQWAHDSFSIVERAGQSSTVVREVSIHCGAMWAADDARKEWDDWLATQ